MSESPTTVGNNRDALIGRFAPGLRQLQDYRREWLRIDLVAGVSIAAVALPTAIAYAQLIGFEPIVGLYAAILPLVVYALLGTSRQLIVNPDAATCAIFAATVLPLAGGDPDTLRSLSVALAVLTGLVCIAAGIFRLGFLADFCEADPGRLSQWRGDQYLSRPDRESVWLPHAIARHPPAAYRVCWEATSNPSTDACRGIDDARGHHRKQTLVASRAGAIAGHGGGYVAGLWPWLGDQRGGGCRRVAGRTARPELAPNRCGKPETPSRRRFGRGPGELQQQYGDGKEFCRKEPL